MLNIYSSFRVLLSNPIVLNLTGRFISLLAPLVVLPAVLNYMGERSFGIWITGVSVSALAAFLDFGIGNSLLTRLASFHGKGDLISARRAIATSLGFLITVSALGVVVLIAVLVVVLLAQDSVGESSYSDLALVAMVFLIFLASLPVFLIHRVFLAHQRFLSFNILLVAQSLISIFSVFLAIYIEAPNWAVAASYGGAPVLMWFGVNVVFFARFVEYRPCLSDIFTFSDPASILRLGAAHFVLGVLGAVGMNADIPVIMRALSSEAVAEFALPARLGSLFYLFIATAFVPLWGIFGAAIAAHDFRSVRREALRYSFAGLILVGFSSLTILFGLHGIMDFWASRQFENQVLVVFGYSVFAMVIAFTSPWNMVLNAMGLVNVQIAAWALFVSLSVLVKLAFVGVFDAWIVGFVSALFYIFFVTIPVVFSAFRAIERGLNEHAKSRCDLVSGS
tara:strand:+ start:2671 stop:4020 length:1350 start_codon:yes stop_codon:yes gene_type:complete